MSVNLGSRPKNPLAGHSLFCSCFSRFLPTFPFLTLVPPTDYCYLAFNTFNPQSAPFYGFYLHGEFHLVPNFLFGCAVTLVIETDSPEIMANFVIITCGVIILTLFLISYFIFVIMWPSLYNNSFWQFIYSFLSNFSDIPQKLANMFWFVKYFALTKGHIHCPSNCLKHIIHDVGGIKTCLEILT